MAFELEFIEGFDPYGLDEAAMRDKWPQFSDGAGYILLASAPVRGGSGSSLRVRGLTSTAWQAMHFRKTYRCVVVGFAIQFPVSVAAIDSLDPHPLQIGAGSGTQLTLRMNTLGNFELRRGSYNGTLLDTSTTVFQPGTFYYLELKVFIDSAVGAYELKIDGATEFSDTGVNTQNLTESYASGLTWHNHSALGAGDYYLDDVYVNGDPTTNTAGGFKGDLRVVTLRPDADGANSAWTRSTGTVDYSLIDEAQPDGVDYLESSTAAQKYSVSHETLAGSETIVAVQQQVHTSCPDGTTRNVDPLCRSNSIDYSQAATRAMDEHYTNHVYEVDPNTSVAWATAGLNAAEFGLEVS